MDPNEAYIVPVTFESSKRSVARAASETKSSLCAASTPGSQSTASRAADEHDEFSVNMMHMRLMHNFSSPAFMTIQTVGKGDIPATIYYQHALRTPYIMNECLAASALHLAATEPESERFYREYAAGLLHKALILFNNAHPVMEVTAKNCETMFLWSSLVSVHVLSEAFIFQRESIRTFMHAFAEGTKLYRGVLIVIDQCKDLLFATETGTYLKHSGATLRATTARDGPECEHLKQMLDQSDAQRDVRELCLSATLGLQHIFNVQRIMPGTQIVVPVILAWPILISADFIELLKQLHPLALVVFAQYAVLLHRARNLWVIGGGGEYLIRAISEHLGIAWQQYLEPPLAALQEPPSVALSSQEGLMEKT
jgi:hypothetical protein